MSGIVAVLGLVSSVLS